MCVCVCVYVCVCVCVCVLGRVRLFGDLIDYSPPGSLSPEISSQEYCGGLPFPTPGDLPNPGIKPVSAALVGGFFTTGPPGKPCLFNT